MRTDLQLIQSAIASEDLKKEHIERLNKKDILWLHIYSVSLPDKFKGLPLVWIFGILPQQNTINAEQEDLIFEEARCLIREYVGEPKDQPPIVLISDDQNIHFGDQLLFKEKAVFFLDKFELPGRDSFANSAKDAPILLSARRKFKTSGASYLLSPYSPNKPVTDWRFFGRKKEVRSILESKSNFFVIGSRRIGKTSILQEVSSQMQKRGETVYWIEVQSKTRYQEVIEETAQKLLYRDLTQLQQTGRSNDWNYFTAVLRKLRGDKKNIVLILDEIGNVITKSPNESWKFFGILRELSHNNEIRVIVSAFQEVVLKQLSNFDGPFVNFGNTLKVNAFTKMEIEELLISPLQFWGRIRDRAKLANKIKRTFGAHPLILQHLGNKLFQLINDNEEDDVEDILDSLFEGEELIYFQPAIDDIFFKTTSYLERYVFLRLCIDIDNKDRELITAEITQEWLRAILDEIGVGSDLDSRVNLLERFCLRGLMSQDPTNHHVFRIDCPIVFRYLKVFESPVQRLMENYLGEIRPNTLNQEDL